MVNALSPLDGRYEKKVATLKDYFSEEALIKYRVLVEIEYLLQLSQLNLKGFKPFDSVEIANIKTIIENFDHEDALKIKEIERVTNHDVKAVEYFIKDKFDGLDLDDRKEFVHFGLTSQDINNTAFPLMLKASMDEIMLPQMQAIRDRINNLSVEYQDIPMLARTHGQAASPTMLGKEMAVFVERLDDQIDLLTQLPNKAKFGGATGNFNAHLVSFSDVDWISFANSFISSLGLKRSHKTTQIAHYDHMAAIFMNLSRINTILIDFCRDIWTYISMDYFKQKVIDGEVGSSAMPHKVNPIDFENAEGNLGMSNAVFNFLAEKLPISRLQRDLTDSTVLRNIGVPFGHQLIALKSIDKGISKLLVNQDKISADLDENWAVVSEAIQNILRREGFEKPYEALKALTRGNHAIDKTRIHAFIDTLKINQKVKDEMKGITPHNYTGIHE